MMPLPPLLPPPAIRERLRMVFPDGTEGRNYVTREIAAKTVFVMLYVGAVEGRGTWLRPDQVTRMTDAQATSTEEADREAWAGQSVRRTTAAVVGRWYAVNTREPFETKLCARDSFDSVPWRSARDCRRPRPKDGTHSRRRLQRCSLRA